MITFDKYLSDIKNKNKIKESSLKNMYDKYDKYNEVQLDYIASLLKRLDKAKQICYCEEKILLLFQEG